MTLKQKLDIYKRQVVRIDNVVITKVMRAFEDETGVKPKPGQAIEWACRKSLESIK
jgi:hypothetical protein